MKLSTLAHRAIFGAELPKGIVLMEEEKGYGWKQQRELTFHVHGKWAIVVAHFRGNAIPADKESERVLSEAGVEM